jgi:hypothetical protein
MHLIAKVPALDRSNNPTLLWVFSYKEHDHADIDHSDTVLQQKDTAGDRH